MEKPGTMDNEYSKTEELLEKGKHISMTFSECKEMKSQLLSYAKFHGVKSHSSVNATSRGAWWLRSLSATTLAFFLFMGTGYASTDSLPGEPLYAMKVYVVEEFISATQLSDVDKLTYKVHQLEDRLAEIHQLASQGLLTLDTIKISQETIQNHVDDVASLINRSTSTLRGGYVIDATGNIVSIARATEKVIGTEFSEAASDSFEDVVSDAVDMYQFELKSFIAAETDVVVQEYIENQLSEIASEIAEEDLTDSTTKHLSENLVDVNEALNLDEVDTALKIVNETIQQVKTEEYVNDFSDETTDL